jgi:hypothetical protein
MLKRMSLAEDSSEASEPPSIISPSEFEKLDITPGSSAMSSVFSRSDTMSSSETKSSRSRTSSPSQGRSSSPGFSFHKRSSSRGSVDRQQKKEDSLVRWLRDGTVIYKSVGLGLMDLAVGMHLIKLAAEKKIGSHIAGF